MKTEEDVVLLKELKVVKVRSFWFGEILLLIVLATNNITRNKYIQLIKFLIQLLRLRIEPNVCNPIQLLRLGTTINNKTAPNQIEFQET